MVICAVVAGCFGAIVGSPTLRVRGDYLAIVTLAFGEIFTRVAQNNIGGLTGGANAIPNIPQVSLFGTAFNESIIIGAVRLPSGVLYYVLIVLLVAFVMLVFAHLKDSRLGRAWIAIREDEDAAARWASAPARSRSSRSSWARCWPGWPARSSPTRPRSCAYDSFRFTESVTLLAAVILGGMGTIPGAVLGASILFILPEKLREFADYRLLLFGLGLIVLMRLRPQGLIADRHRAAELVGEPEPDAPVEDEPRGEGGGARMTSPVLAATGVSMQFGGLRALNDVSFALAEGEIIGLIGPNGAGKTTLFNCLTGQYTPTSGTVSRSGQPLPEDPARVTERGRGAHVPEHPAVPEHDRRGERDGRAARADEAEPVVVAVARAGLPAQRGRGGRAHRGAAGVRRPHPFRRRAGPQPALRRPAAAGDRPRAGHRPEGAPARRAHRGHERAGDRGHPAS